MIEEVLNPNNIMRALHQVVSNNGSAGVDKMPAKELYAYLNKNRDQITADIRDNKYLPQPIRGMKILKSNGKQRLLGIATVTDRMLQQAVAQILTNKFELEFDDFRYSTPTIVCNECAKVLHKWNLQTMLCKR